jgi:putative SOS response-associated peptidase YedK
MMIWIPDFQNLRMSTADRRLGEVEATPENLSAMLKPCPAPMEAVAISTKVGNVKNGGPELIEKVEIA